MLDFVILQCLGSVVFVLGVMTGRAIEVWNRKEEDARLREEISELGRKMTDVPRH
jgi:hypothetical protein